MRLALEQVEAVFVQPASEKAHLTRAGPDQPEQHANRGGFTRVVWPEESVDATGGHVEVECVDGGILSEAAGETLGLDQGIGR